MEFYLMAHLFSSFSVWIFIFYWRNRKKKSKKFEFNLCIKIVQNKNNKSKHFKFSLSHSIYLSVSPFSLSLISFFVCNWFEFETTKNYHTQILDNLFDRILRWIFQLAAVHTQFNYANELIKKRTNTKPKL